MRWNINISVGLRFFFFILVSLPCIVMGQKGEEQVFRDIWVFNDSSSIVIGNYGVIEITEDRGKTWINPSSNTTSNLNGIFFKSRLVGWICGTKGCILKTTDGGKTWLSKFSTTAVDLQEIKYVAENKIYATLKTGDLIISADDGETWTGGELQNNNLPDKPENKGKEKISNPSFTEVKQKLKKADSSYEEVNQSKQSTKEKFKAGSKSEIAEDYQNEGPNSRPNAGSGVNRKNRLFNDSIVSFKLSQLKDFWGKYSFLASQTIDYESTEVIKDVFNISKKDSLSREQLQKNVNLSQINSLKKQIGLELTGNYQENFNPSLGAEDILVYRRRVQVGLDWNILQNGFLSNKYKREILKNENTILDLMPRKKLSEVDYMKVFHSIVYAFNEQKIKLLQEREKIIEEKIATANELFIMKSLKKIDLMEMIKQQVDVKSMYQIYKTYNEQLIQTEPQTTSFTKTLPVFDIQMQSLFKYSGIKQSDSILKLKTKNLELQNSFWNRVNLTANLKYNYFDLVQSSSSSRDFISTGFGFSIPLPFNLNSRKGLIKDKNALESFDQKVVSDAQHSELLNHLYEFRYKLKQYNNFSESYKRYVELIRLERVKENFKNYDFNPVTALNYLDELLGVQIEMLDLQQRMYIDLLDIYSKSNANSIQELITPFDGSPSSVELESPGAAMYIWSKSFSRHDNNFIFEYLQVNNINTALISLSNNPEYARNASLLMNRLNKNNVKIEVLVGNNSLFNSNNPEAFIEEILQPYDLSLIQSIHLDIEPQTFPGWDQNKASLLVDYVKLLKKVKSFCQSKNLQLSVSIPTYYDESVLKEIYSLADRVYIMAYENVKPEFLASKLSEELSIGLQKTTIALRFQDFKNNLEVNRLKEYLKSELKVKSFALHEMEGFINLEKGTD